MTIRVVIADDEKYVLLVLKMRCSPFGTPLRLLEKHKMVWRHTVFVVTGNRTSLSRTSACL